MENNSRRNYELGKLIDKYEEDYRDFVSDRKFGQKWEEYNEAQTKEKIIFYNLVKELLDILPKETYTFGRPRMPLKEMLFCCIIKIYTNVSSRRLISELELAKRAGYIKEVPHFNTILKYLDDDLVRIALSYLVPVSALPLKNIEEKFAIDSTGFGAHRFDRYFQAKYGEKTNLSKWRKCHAVCGTYTQVITAIRLTGGNVADIKQFEPLVNDTANLFQIQTVLADKAYLSRRNLDLVKKLGAMPYIPFKKNCVKTARGSGAWAELFKIFTEHYLTFATEYHQRSNIESAWSMIKRKFGDFCRCRTEQSQDAEILCKVLCHNIVILVFEIFNRKLDIDFLACRKYASAHKVRY
jgi:transposase